MTACDQVNAQAAVCPQCIRYGGYCWTHVSMLKEAHAEELRDEADASYALNGHGLEASARLPMSGGYYFGEPKQLSGFEGAQGATEEESC